MKTSHIPQHIIVWDLFLDKGVGEDGIEKFSTTEKKAMIELCLDWLGVWHISKIIV